MLPVQDKQLPPPHYGKELDEEQKYYDSSETSSAQDSDTDDESSPLADLLAALLSSLVERHHRGPFNPELLPQTSDKNVPLCLLPASSRPYPYMLCFAKGCSPSQGKGTLPAFNCTL